jgi:hypothetical protein
VQDKPKTPAMEENNQEENKEQVEGENQIPKTHMEPMEISALKKSDELIQLEE